MKALLLGSLYQHKRLLESVVWGGLAEVTRAESDLLEE